MGRSTSEAFETFESELAEQPTRRLQAVYLPAEACRDAAEVPAPAVGDLPVGNDDATVNIAPAQTQKLLASLFASGPMDGPNTDDEPTLDAPAPVAALAAAAALAATPALDSAASARRPSTRAPALRALVLTPPPVSARSPRSSSRLAIAPAAVIVAAGLPDPGAIPVRFATPVPPAPSSGLRRKLPSSLVQSERVAREVEDRSRHSKTFAIRLPEPSPQLYVVAGIWATALSLLSLLSLLVFMASGV